MPTVQSPEDKALSNTSILNKLDEKLQEKFRHRLNEDDKQQLVAHLAPYNIANSQIESAAGILFRSIKSYYNADKQAYLNKEALKSLDGDLYGNFSNESHKEVVTNVIHQAVKGLNIPAANRGVLEKVLEGNFALRGFNLVGKNEQELNKFASNLQDVLKVITPKIKKYFFIKSDILDIPATQNDKKARPLNDICLTAVDCALTDNAAERIALMTTLNVSKQKGSVVNLSLATAEKFKNNIKDLLDGHVLPQDLEAQRKCAKRLGEIQMDTSSRDNPTLAATMFTAKIDGILTTIAPLHKKIDPLTNESSPAIPKSISPPKAPDAKLKALSDKFLKEYGSVEIIPSGKDNSAEKNKFTEAVRRETAEHSVSRSK
jgi:hypothetical protein